MKISISAAAVLITAVFLWGCAGPAPKAAPTAAAPVSSSQLPPAAKSVNPKFYIVTFDAQGIAHDRVGKVVNRERVLALLGKGEIDQHTGIRIEVPGGIVDREKNIAAFARAQNVAKIFDLLGFEAVVVALAKPSP
jgi:hypothetical protein